MHRFFVKSPIAKILWGILASLAGIILLLLVLVSENERMAAQTLNWEGRSIENGAAIFATNCASCHGLDGKGLPGVAPALNSHYFFTETGRMADVNWNGSLEDYVALTVAAGRPSKSSDQWSAVMPTWGVQFGGPLRQDQVNDVTQYVLNWRESALAQTPEEDPFQPFQDVQKPVELQNIDALSLTEGELEAAIEEIEIKRAEEAAAAGLDTGPAPPQELWVSMGCAGCHNLNQNQADVRGPVGPNMADLYERAASRVEGQTAEEYIYNSIVNPNEYVVESYVANVMPQNFADKMSDEEIQSLVEWLLDPNREQ